MKCAICGKHFAPNPKAHGQKYCGRRCYLIANRKNKHAQTQSADKPIRTNNLPLRNDFEVIPQAPNYEMNSFGVVRNISSGKILKWHKDSHGISTMTLGWGKEKVCVSLPNLLWLLHGNITHRKALTVPCAVEKGTRYLRFDTITACAHFLANATHLTFGGAYFHLARRKSRIAGWQISYFNYG